MCKAVVNLKSQYVFIGNHSRYSPSVVLHLERSDIAAGKFGSDVCLRCNGTSQWRAEHRAKRTEPACKSVRRHGQRVL